jgi:O-succinylbenzoate synthase
VRISGFDLYRYDLALSEPVTLKDATLHRREGALIRLTADDGSRAGARPPLSPTSAPRACKTASNNYAR